MVEDGNTEEDVLVRHLAFIMLRTRAASCERPAPSPPFSEQASSHPRPVSQSASSSSRQTRRYSLQQRWQWKKETRSWRMQPRHHQSSRQRPRARARHRARWRARSICCHGELSSVHHMRVPGTCVHHRCVTQGREVSPSNFGRPRLSQRYHCHKFVALRVLPY